MPREERPMTGPPRELSLTKQGLAWGSHRISLAEVAVLMRLVELNEEVFDSTLDYVEVLVVNLEHAAFGKPLRG